ncbi:MAG: hypothetical protein RR549_01230, partial [Oscillospiraceae bacterium]
MNNIKYAILANPGHNRVYFDNSVKLSLSEITLAATKTSSTINNICYEKIANISYITFDCNEYFNENDLKIISSLSFFYALFTSLDNFKSLIPVAKVEYESLNPSISSILKYQGKTNEIFTKMMINCAAFSLDDYNANKKLNLFDPVCGKGTTLFEGAVLGFDVAGCEISQKSINETKVFFKKFLENDKIKHTLTREGYNVKSAGAAIKGDIFKFNFSSNKDEFKKGENISSLMLCDSNSFYCDKIFKSNSFDLIIGDLPYGIVHSNVSQKEQKGNKNGKSPTRNPFEMIENCLNPWQKVIKKGG